MTINYFAYGSNLSSFRLLQRLPEAEVSGIATLEAHQLCWRKNGTDDSGKCDMAHTGNQGDVVYGVVYRMTLPEQEKLDEMASAGFGYERRNISIYRISGEKIDAFTYFALDIDHNKQPYHWYKEHVLRGAIEHEFPEDYVERIRATIAIEDQDLARHQREMSIYTTA